MKTLATIIFLLLLIIGSYLILDKKDSEIVKNDTTDVVADQNPIDENNKEDNPDLKDDLIIVDIPKNSDKVSSPLKISGKARGYWFFEASFPIFVTDWDGKIIGEGFAQADGDWMTEEFVPFTAEITFNKSEISGQYSDRGALILKKDNPSGLPEHDDALEMLIYFK